MAVGGGYAESLHSVSYNGPVPPQLGTPHPDAGALADLARRRWCGRFHPFRCQCGSTAKATRIWRRRGRGRLVLLYQCPTCRRQTSVTAGTFIERTRVLPRQWVEIAEAIVRDRPPQNILALERSRRIPRKMVAMSAWELHKRVGLGGFANAQRVLARVERALREASLFGLHGGWRVTAEVVLWCLLDAGEGFLHLPSSELKKPGRPGQMRKDLLPPLRPEPPYNKIDAAMLRDY